MAGARLSFEERKAVLKWYFKFEKISEVQRQWQNEFGTQPPTCLTIVRIRDKFEINGIVGDVHKEIGVVEFPPRSPELTPLDFYLWGYLRMMIIGGNQLHWMIYEKT